MNCERASQEFLANFADAIRQFTEQNPPPINPNFYIKRSAEGLVLPVSPSSDQLVVSAKKELRVKFGRDFEVPEPPQDLFETLQGFAERGISGFDEVYFQPGLQFTENDKFWKGKGRVKPWRYFWKQIKNGNFPSEAAMLEEGWFIGDRRGKPMYENGEQEYGEDDYLEPLMAYLRGSNGIRRLGMVPACSRFGAFPTEIEKVILPEFSLRSGAKGTVRNRRYMEFNFRGNIAHPEYGQTDTWEWFGDPVSQGDGRRLAGGNSIFGGLACVHDNSVGNRHDRVGFSLVVAFPSKPR